MHYGKSLVIAMALKGVSNKNLAEYLKQAPQTVSSWKRSGSIKQITLVKICKFLEMEVSDFVKLSEGQNVR